MSREFTVKNIGIVSRVDGELDVRVINSEKKLLDYLEELYYDRKLDRTCLRELQKENTELREKELRLEDDNHRLRIERDKLSIKVEALENVLKYYKGE